MYRFFCGCISYNNWFIQNCADGVDECQPIYVSIQKAKELLETIKIVKKNRDKANEILPTQSGFFFGGTEYDEWYFEALNYTEELLIKLIDFCNRNKEYDMIYQASW